MLSGGTPRVGPPEPEIRARLARDLGIPDSAILPVLGAHIKGQSYFDLASTVTVGDHYNFRLGVNNIFDKNPPLVTASVGSCPAGPCNGNTYPGTWDALGRYIYAAATLNF